VSAPRYLPRSRSPRRESTTSKKPLAVGRPDRKVFLSPDCKVGQLRAVCLTIWRSTFGARTFHAEFLGKAA
jgi:hypothetical protein